MTEILRSEHWRYQLDVDTHLAYPRHRHSTRLGHLRKKLSCPTGARRYHTTQADRKVTEHDVHLGAWVGAGVAVGGIFGIVAENIPLGVTIAGSQRSSRPHRARWRPSQPFEPAPQMRVSYPLLPPAQERAMPYRAAAAPASPGDCGCLSLCRTRHAGECACAFASGGVGLRRRGACEKETFQRHRHAFEARPAREVSCAPKTSSPSAAAPGGCKRRCSDS